MDGRTHTSIRKLKTKDHGDTVFGSLQLRLPKRDNNGRKHKRLGGYPMARTTGRETKTDRLRQSFPFRHRKEIRNK